MKVLPQTRRGTWLLAVAAWTLGSALLWWILPTSPQLRVPFERGFLGFTPDAQAVLFQRAISAEDGRTGKRIIDLQLKSTDSGQVIKSLGSFGQSESGPVRSPDGWFWLIRDSDEFDEQKREIVCRFLRVDLATQSTTKFSCLRSEIEDRAKLELSPGGRFCVVEEVNDLKPALIWDLVNNRIHSPDSEIVGPIVFSRDGRYLAGRSMQVRTSAHVIDLNQIRTIAELRAPNLPPSTAPGAQPIRIVRLLFNNDNSRLAADVFPATAGQLVSWQIATGKIDAEFAGYLVDFTYDGTSLVTNGPKVGNILVHDLESGKVTTSFQTPASWPCQLSLDGRTVLASTQEFGAGFLAQLAARLGLPWPFQKSRDRIQCRLFDISTGDKIGEFTMKEVTSFSRNLLLQMAFDLIPNGRITVLDDRQPSTWAIYEIPPRKSLSDFAIRLAILAAVIVLLALWRIRRLQRT
jgi:hypothetical protein